MANSTSTTFIIYNTAGQPITAIQPNTLNGPDGVQQSSDLRMYGLGFANWGEGVNENDYHIVESFACPNMSGYPLSPRYNATTASYTPASAVELGDGNGINVPIVGQLWFNTTLQSLYIYTAADMFVPVAGTAVSTGTVPPAIPSIGQLWYNTGIPQLEVWSGTAWTSVAARYLPLTGGTLTGILSMNGNKITNLNTPTTSTDAATKGYVDASIGGVSGYVPTTGGTMTGALNMTSAGINITGGPGLTIHSASGIAVTSGSITMTSPTGGISLTANGRITAVSSPLTSTDAVNLSYANSSLNYLNLTSGGTVSGATTFGTNLSIGGNKLVNVATPTASTDGVNKAYVDAQVAAVAAILAKGATSTLTRTAASGLTADPSMTIALAANSVYNVTVMFYSDSGDGVYMGLYYSGSVVSGFWGGL